jgi:hypothetical protein
MIDVEAMCIKAEILCRTLAPKDLGDMPLYVVQQSAVPSEIGGNCVDYAFTSPCLDLYLRDVIGPAWRGRGGCMVINDTEFGEMQADDIGREFLALVLHELAHILERPAVYRERVNESPVRIQFEAFVLGREVSQEVPVEQEEFAFIGHGLDFIRIVLHLCHRINAIGLLMSPWQIYNTRSFDLSHINQYRHALGDEPVCLTQNSFREILSTLYPEEFSRLWAEDVACRQRCVSP